MSVLLISASPTLGSRSAALSGYLLQKFQSRYVPSMHLPVRQLDAVALVQAQFQHPHIVQATQQVADADVVVVTTPVYKAAYSGLLKIFLDLLGQTALKGKTVLPIATGGSPHHMLALDYALRPVLQALGASHILPGIYAVDSQVQVQPDGQVQLHEDIARRLEEAVEVILREKIQPHLKDEVQKQIDQQQERIDFEKVQCSC